MINESLLSKNYIFTDIQAPYWMELKDSAVIKHYKRHETIYLSDDNADCVYLVCSGLVMLSRLKDHGAEIGQSVITPHCTFGELEVLNQIKREQQATALSDVELCVVPAQVFNSLSKKSARFSRNVAKLISQRQRRSECRQVYLAGLEAPNRLAQLLLEIAHAIGHEDHRGRHFTPCLTHQDMATLIISSRETVSSTMSNFRKYKMIDFDRKHVSIINEQALANY